MKTTIVLLTDIDLELTQQCLKYIRRYADEPYELIVVNNGSEEETVAYLQAQDDIQLIVNSENEGIARGYNQGTELASGKYLLFMTYYSLLTEKSLSSMLLCLQDEDEAAMVGPVSNEVSGYQRINIPYADLSQIASFARINREKKLGARKQVFRLLSHCLLVKKDVLEELGGFDERFGRETYEDDDLCLRAVNKGYSLYVAQDAFVHYINPLSSPSFNKFEYYQLLTENRQKAIDKWGFDIAEYLIKLRVPISISLCMIVKNEEEVLARCLDCVKGIADEIIIVDTGSTDKTKEIAGAYTDKIYDFAWIDDFAAARNYAFQQASKEYILWLDADDIIMEEDRIKFLALKQNLDPTIDSVTMNYNLAFDQYGNVTTSLRRNRLVKRLNHFSWIGAVHEYLAVYGRIMDSDIAVTHKSEWHDSDRNLKIYEKRLATGEVFSPRDQYYYANELMDHKNYKKAVEWYQKFLDSGLGWVEDNIATCRKLADCFFQIGDPDNALKFIFKSFLYDTPRAEFCCQLGYHFLSLERFKHAVFWYKLATQLERPFDNRGFVNHACWTWVPHIQLCVCYDRLGEYELAYQHNEIAATFIPDDINIIKNRSYLKKILKKE
ncbi:glycosyl transferase, group 2 family protein [hydrocarbon metagenome]|uniref:Glycosyl transferase, group 2 family protein n=1 Tax=hydrocarbon metagenome TaxID=938273 RepID=A0A0W8E6S7_9ZZZZ